MRLCMVTLVMLIGSALQVGGPEQQVDSQSRRCPRPPTSRSLPFTSTAGDPSCSYIANDMTCPCVCIHLLAGRLLGRKLSSRLVTITRVGSTRFLSGRKAYRTSSRHIGKRQELVG